MSASVPHGAVEEEPRRAPAVGGTGFETSLPSFSGFAPVRRRGTRTALMGEANTVGSARRYSPDCRVTAVQPPCQLAKCDPISVLRGLTANSAADLSSSLPGVAHCLPASPPQIRYRDLVRVSTQIGNRAWSVLPERTSASPRIVSGNSRVDVFLAGTVCTGDSRFQPDNPVVSRMSGRCAGRSARAARTFSARTLV